ncbi:MAG: DNA topoisomerase 1 [Trizodia sp. TS-e1964]|nr:MAG: DNA topoisomerase 1 [Trizodia sp. TS-e1964]
MSSSEDEMPLLRTRKVNTSVISHSSKATFPADADTTMEDSMTSNTSLQPGISIRNGPMEMEVDSPENQKPYANGTGSRKRKPSRSATNQRNYDETMSSEDSEAPHLSKRRRTTTIKTNDNAGESNFESEDEPLAKKSGSSKNLKKPPKASETAIGDLSDSDVPLNTKLVKTKAKIQKDAAKEAIKARTNAKSSAKSPNQTRKRVKNEESDSDVPIAKSRGKPNGTSKPAVGSKKLKRPKKEESEDGSDSDVKPVAKKARKSTKAESSGNPKASKKTMGAKKAAKKSEADVENEAADEEAEEEEYRWWEDIAKGDGTVKWTTLEHAGVLFPPEYEPLPSNVKLLYDGVPVTLHPNSEEIAGFFGAMLNSTVNVTNETFVKNFFTDFKASLQETGGARDKDNKKIQITDFSKCDFTPIFNYYEAKRAEKKALSVAEKKALKAEKDALEAPYTHCLWDNRKEKVGNFRVEPPGLFRGRGAHPKTGHVKKRVLPEQISINIGKEATVPAPPEGHNWKEVRHDNGGTWLAMWQENINSAYKYVMLAANSTVKGQSDFRKFEKARELKLHIDQIRADYTKEMKAELMADRQRATAMYLIDQFALRAGNEKGEEEADTVGCCSLKFEHVTLRPPNTVIFDFLGKDSIPFYNEFEVDIQVFKNLKIFKKHPKKVGDEIFDRLNTGQLNNHLRSYMPGLSAKVFRTYNASYTMAKLLKKLKAEGSIQEKVKAYNDANREVAILCNHKRTVGAAHTGQMQKIENQIKGMKYQKWRLKQMILNLDPKSKKKMGADYFNLDEDISEDWIIEHQAFLVQECRSKIEKKFQKENEALVADGKREMKAKELAERQAVADEMEKKFKLENKSKKFEPEGKAPTLDKLKASIEKLDQRVETMLVQAEDRENNKEVALGTSKINYIDPRLTVVFAKKFNVPIEKFFSKSLREKFDWAIKSAEEDWEF